MFDKLKRGLKVEAAEGLEVYGEKIKFLDCKIRKNEIDFVSDSLETGVAVRAIKDGKLGFSSSNNVSRIEKCAERALELSKQSESELSSFSQPVKYPSVGNISKKSVKEISTEKLLEDMQKGIQKANSLGAKIPGGFVRASVKDRYLINSNGIEVSSTQTKFIGRIDVLYRDNVESWSETSTGMKSVPEIVSKSYSLAKKAASKKSIESGERDVIIKPNALTSIFRILTPSFNGERVRRKRSKLRRKVGEKIGSEKITINDNHILSGGFNSSAFDREGARANNTELVKEGILRGFLYDRKTAISEDKQTTSNLSGGYRTSPEISPSNWVVEGERRDKNEVQQASKDPLVIYEVAGAHTANPISGDFSLNVTTGFKNERGIKQAVFVGNVFELLKNVECLTDERRNLSFLNSPSLVVKNQKIVT